MCQQHLAQDIKHYYLHAELCRGGLAEVPNDLPADLDRNDKAAARKWIIEQLANRNRQTWAKRSEIELSEEYAQSLTSLVKAQKLGFCKPRSLTIDIVIHEAYLQSRPLDQCGLTLHVEVKFHSSEINAESPEVETSPLNLPFHICDIEPKRRVLLPLLSMQNIQGIHVKRTWTVKIPKKRLEDSSSSDEDLLTGPPQEIPMVQQFRYRTALEFFLAAGKELMNFRDIGIAEAGVKKEHILQIQENTPQVGNAISMTQKSTNVADLVLKSWGAEWKPGSA